MSSLHADALAALRSYSPTDDEQARLRDRYVAHLEAHPDGLSRSCRPDHVTASTLVLSADHSQVLLTLHAKAREWFQLGGHVDADDESLAGAALREVGEESGLTSFVAVVGPVHLDEHAVPFCGGVADGLVAHHLDVRYVAVAGADVVPVVSEESLDVRWWPVDDLPNPDLAGLVQSALSALSRLSNS